MNRTINSFGTVYGAFVPLLLSLTDNKDGNILVKWDHVPDKKRNKLKIEWTEARSDDIDECDEDWQYKQFDLYDNNNKTIRIGVGNKITTYLFRIQYFDGIQWSINSNIKSVSVKK
eukprot:350384_1